MAEKAIVAFGRYLKLLRERRGFSLDDVATLTKAYPEPINKGYLSRAERGLSHIAFSKIVALGRAYEIPIDVFGEKLSLDLEVDQLKDGPKTEGKTFGELLVEGTRLGRLGLRVQAYSVIRDALPRSLADPVVANYETRAEQAAAAILSLGIVSGALGRLRLALHEIHHAETLDALRFEFMVTAFMQLSAIHRRLGDYVQARTYADRAVSAAETPEARRFLPDAFSTSGVLADAEGRHDDAIAFHKNAFAQYKLLGRHAEAARAMANLANSYFNAGRRGAARRALEVAYRIATETGNEGTRSRSKILLGEIDAIEGRRARASALWLEALEIAKRANDRVAAFKAEFQLFKSAIEQGHEIAASAFGRRLNKLWPWIPPGEAEVKQFRAMWSAHRPRRRSGVVKPQRATSR